MEAPTQLLISLLRNMVQCGNFKRGNIMIDKPGGNVVRYSIDILQTENYLIIHVHSRGSHWNLGGNSYKYYHSILSGLFIPDEKLPLQAWKESIINKSKFTIKNYNECVKIVSQK